MAENLEILIGDILRQGDGRPWIADGGRYVPKKCPFCGENIGLFFEGEPIFRCKGNKKHYYGTLELDLPEEQGRNKKWKS